MSASLVKFEVERTGEAWWGGVAWVCTWPVITVARCLRQPDNNPLDRIGDAVATGKIILDWARCPNYQPQINKG